MFYTSVENACEEVISCSHSLLQLTSVTLTGQCIFIFSHPLIHHQDAKIEPEEFTNRLQLELKSSPQPYLVPFLKVGTARKLTPTYRQTDRHTG